MPIVAHVDYQPFSSFGCVALNVALVSVYYASCCSQILSSRAYEHWVATQLSTYALRLVPSGFQEGPAVKRARF